MNKTVRTKTIRRLTLLATGFVVVVAAAGGFYTYRKAQIRLQYSHLRANGLADAREGRNAEAVDLLARYLQRYPSDLEPLEQYARLRPLVAMPKNEHLRQAIYALRQLAKVQTDSAARHQTQQKLLDLYSDPSLRFWTEADQLAQALLPNPSSATASDLGILTDWTRARLALRDFSGALVPGRRWSSLAPLDLEAQTTLLQLTQQTQRFDGFVASKKGQPAGELDVADALASAMKRAIAAEAGTGASANFSAADPRPSMIRAYALLLMGRMKEAADLIDKAAAFHFTDRKTVQILVTELDAVGRSDQSLVVLRRLESETHDSVILNVIVRRLWEAGDYKGVASLSQDTNLAGPTADVEVLALRGSALDRLGRGAEATPIFKTLAARTDDPVAVAWARLLQPAVGAGASPQQISHECEEALKVRSSPYLLYFLANAYSQLGRAEQAIQSMRRSASQAPTWAAPAVELSRLLSSSGQMEASLQFARDAMRRDPHSGLAAMNLARVWGACIHSGVAGQPQELLTLLDRICQQIKDDGSMLAVKVDVLAVTGRTTEATGQIREALRQSQNPLSEPALLQLAALSGRYKLGLEQACLDRCQTDHGATAALALARATTLLVEGKINEAIIAFEACRRKATDSQSPQWRSAWCRCLDLAQDSRAAGELTRLSDSQPDNLPIQLQVLDSRTVQADRPLLVKAIGRVRQLTGDQGTAWRFAQARLLLTGSPTVADVQHASDLLHDALRLMPDSLEAHFLLARCAELNGRLGDAVAEMKVATGLNPASVPLGLSLASLLERHGEFDAARDELTRIRALPSFDPMQRRAAAALAAQAGDPKLALSLAEDAADRASADQNLLIAQMYWLTGKPIEALRICQALLQKDADLPTIQLAAEINASQGRMDDANAMLARLNTVKLDPGVKQLVWADFAGRYVGVEAQLKYLEQAIEAAPGSAQAWKAMIAFHLAQGAGEQAAADLARAAAAVPADPSIMTLKQKSAMLVAAAARPDLRSFAVALARNPNDVAMSAALAELLPAGASAPPAQFANRARNLADRYPQSLALQLYCVECDDRAGRMDDAANVAVRASQSFPGAAEPHAIYAALLQEHQRWSEALAEAKKWRDRMLTRKLPADMLIAEAYLHLKLPSQALTQLEPYVTNAGSSAQERQVALPLYAQARQMIGNTDTAQLMAPLLDQGPSGRQAWIKFALANLEPAEASAWLDRADKAIPADALGERIMLGQAWGFLAQKDHDPNDMARARRVLQSLCDKPNAAEPAFVALAMELEMQNQLTEAATLYRRALQASPRDIIALNNLAMVLVKTGGNLNEAAELARSAIAARPDVPALYDTLATIQSRQRKYEPAVASARKAVELQPQSLQYHLTLTQALLDGGQRSAAIDALRTLDALHLDTAKESQSLQDQLQRVRSALVGAHAQATVR